MLAASCSTGGTEDAAAAEKAAAAQQANTETFLAQDMEAITATYTEDIEFFNGAAGDRRSGEAEMKSLMTAILRMTDTDATEIIERFVSVDGTFGVVNVHWVGENSYGAPLDLTYVQLQEFEDGLISNLTMYWEDPDANKQFNAQPDS